MTTVRSAADVHVRADARVVFVVVAAGAGTRLGGVAKALLAIDGTSQSYLGRILALEDRVAAAPSIVVVGPPYDEEIRARFCAHPSSSWVSNPEPARGMASSIALGFARLLRSASPAIEAAFLWPVDHPFVTDETLLALIRARGSHQVARPRFDRRGGHPPLIARVAWPALAACTRVDGGARAVIAGLDVIDVDVDDPGVVRDVDTPAELAEVSR